MNREECSEQVTLANSILKNKHRLFSKKKTLEVFSD